MEIASTDGGSQERLYVGSPVTMETLDVRENDAVAKYRYKFRINSKFIESSDLPEGLNTEILQMYDFALDVASDVPVDSWENYQQLVAQSNTFVVLKAGGLASCNAQWDVEGQSFTTNLHGYLQSELTQNGSEFTPQIVSIAVSCPGSGESAFKNPDKDANPTNVSDERYARILQLFSNLLLPEGRNVMIGHSAGAEALLFGYFREWLQNVVALNPAVSLDQTNVFEWLSKLISVENASHSILGKVKASVVSKKIAGPIKQWVVKYLVGSNGLDKKVQQRLVNQICEQITNNVKAFQAKCKELVPADNIPPKKPTTGELEKEVESQTTRLLKKGSVTAAILWSDGDGLTPSSLAKVFIKRAAARLKGATGFMTTLEMGGLFNCVTISKDEGIGHSGIFVHPEAQGVAIRLVAQQLKDVQQRHLRKVAVVEAPAALNQP